MDSDSIAEMLEHLGRKLHTASFAANLKPAQWTALRYLGRANGAARTPSAFARFQATTRSTASQTLKVLVDKGLVSVERSSDDARVRHLELTTAGRELLRSDPLRPLLGALAEADAAQLSAFSGVLAACLKVMRGGSDKAGRRAPRAEPV